MNNEKFSINGPDRKPGLNDRRIRSNVISPVSKSVLDEEENIKHADILKKEIRKLGDSTLGIKKKPVDDTQKINLTARQRHDLGIGESHSKLSFVKRLKRRFFKS